MDKGIILGNQTRVLIVGRSKFFNCIDFEISRNSFSLCIIRQSYQDKITLTKTTNKNNDNADYQWILKHSESVYASELDFGWSRKVFPDHPPNQNIYCVNMGGLGIPSETIQNLISDE